jgi:hypothetical protein
MSPLGDSHTSPRPRRRRALLLASASLVLVSTGGVALAGAGTAGSAPDGSAPPASEAAPASSIEPTLSAAFALLRRAQTHADVIPASTQVAFSQASGANPLLARRVSDGEGEEAWLVAGNASACILAQVPRYDIGGAVCVPADAARAGELDVQSASSQLPGSELVAGVMPDGVDSVTLHLAGGSTVTAPVREDIYLALVQGAVDSISASGPQGAIAIEGLSASSASPRFAR